jgi:hypothetical protein
MPIAPISRERREAEDRMARPGLSYASPCTRPDCIQPGSLAATQGRVGQTAPFGSIGHITHTVGTLATAAITSL